MRAVDWRIVPVSYGYHRLLFARRDLIEHTYEVISTLEAILQQVTDAETGP
jgi:hypothetical protein